MATELKRNENGFYILDERTKMDMSARIMVGMESKNYYKKVAN